MFVLSLQKIQQESNFNYIEGIKNFVWQAHCWLVSWNMTPYMTPIQ